MCEIGLWPFSEPPHNALVVSCEKDDPGKCANTLWNLNPICSDRHSLRHVWQAMKGVLRLWSAAGQMEEWVSARVFLDLPKASHSTTPWKGFGSRSRTQLFTCFVHDSTLDLTAKFDALPRPRRASDLRKRLCNRKLLGDQTGSKLLPTQ